MLDEVTSSLDLETEKQLIRNLMSLENDITIIFIAHRLVHYQNVLRIIEIKKGSIHKIHTPKSLGLS